MFKNEYQGGPVVEIFSAQGKDPVAKWKLSGGPAGISKEFDKEVKGFVYSLEGSSQTNRMQIPRDSKMALGLVQKFLVLQVKVPLGKDFCTELLITDAGHLKRRLYLSTVHKEVSATPLHARIPLTSLARNVWCNMCIDVSSFTREMFKGAVFLYLDGISISASCKVRRIFTMKTQPLDSDRDLYIYRNGVLDEIPRGCQFPTEVQHITQVINMKNLAVSDIRTGPLKTDSEQTGPASARATSALSATSATSARSTKSQDPSHVAFGSRVAGPPPPTGKKNNPASSRHEDKAPTDHNGLSGRSRKFQPRPPPDRAASERTQTRRPQMHSAGRERPVLTGGVVEGGILPHPQKQEDVVYQAPAFHLKHHSIGHDRADASEDEVTSLCSLEDGCLDDSDQEAGPLDDEPDRLSVPRELSAPLSAPVAPGEGGDSDVSDKEEPRFVLEAEEAEEEKEGEEEEVFTFSSRPHSARRVQGLCNSVQDATFDLSALCEDDGGVRKEARPEDDFIGSESEEDDAYPKFLLQRGAVHSSPAPRDSPGPSHSGPNSPSKSPTEPRQMGPDAAGPAHSPGVTDGSRRPDHSSVAPTRCQSPSAPRQGPRLDHPSAGKRGPDGDCRMSLSKRSLREIPPEDWRYQMGDGSRPNVSVSSSRDLHKLGEEEEEELRMLASLCREQTEEDEQEDGRGHRLSASQQRRCNVSLSISSDDTTTWTQCYPVPANQGQYYQKEMNPLLHSNPREWMDVLSPPIIPPSQQRAKAKDDLCKVRNEGVKDDGCDDEFLNLLYDPSLNCYFDPQSGKYYELA